MTRIVCITGTDTEVGKTVVTAALAALAAEREQRVAVVKPAQTGVRPDEPGDLQVVRRLAGIEDVHELARFEEPLAPATAARRAGLRPPTVAEIADAVRRLAKEERDLVLVEGAGGLLVELDAGRGTLADLALLLGAPMLVVARAGLGTLNATALTCHAIRARGLTCLGTAIGAWPDEPDLAERSNLEDLPCYAGAPLLGQMAAGSGALSREEFLEVARAGMTPALEACLAPAPA